MKHLFFEIAKKYIDIVTVTVDGSSKILPYIKYEDLTGEKPYTGKTHL